MLGTSAVVIHFIISVPFGIVFTTPWDNLPNSFANDLSHIFFSCPGTFPLDNCVYPNSFSVSGCNTWNMYSSYTFIDIFLNIYLWRNDWWCIISAAYPNCLEFLVDYYYNNYCNLNHQSSAGMMCRLISYSLCVREYLVLPSGFISLDWLFCGITCGVLFQLIFFTCGDGVVCPFFVSSILEGCVITLIGCVSTLRGGVVCYFIGSFCFLSEVRNFLLICIIIPFEYLQPCEMVLRIYFLLHVSIW